MPGLSFAMEKRGRRVRILVTVGALPFGACVVDWRSLRLDGRASTDAAEEPHTDATADAPHDAVLPLVLGEQRALVVRCLAGYYGIDP